MWGGGEDLLVGSLMLEGTSGVPKSNLLFEAGLLLNCDCLLRALSGVVLKTYKDKRLYNLYWQLFPYALLSL